MMRSQIKYWRESASIIALAKNKSQINPKLSNYKILLQQRSHKSGFLPSTIVFPGGTIEANDGKEDWFKHFNSFGIENTRFKEFISNKALIPPIMQDEKSLENRQVALRITAIRETFEELGVLICKSRSDDKSALNAGYIEDFDVKTWQSKVHKDPMEFLNLCQHLDCYPDIFSLYTWSNWLTPIGYENQRFDTIFFLTFFNEQPKVHAEKSEVMEVWWSSPEEIMGKYDDKFLMIPPPQWYELSKLFMQKNFDRLMNFAAKRSCLGCEQIYPIILHPNKAKGYIAIFPGDELYPEFPDFEKQTKVFLGDKTIEELQDEARVTHRMEVYGLYDVKVHLKNFSPFQSQLSPCDSKIPEL